ncbi:fructosamine kinase family protein [Pelagicoccus sp. SDUM812003]|uniref:fructosamine kinase family protein n=1 Tax=Pelagicoccus sp. SDUM812003 TaxID=3041267 RepID=UPI00280E8DEF|nr:fructosamine kinase family protein [Pelagicoccus sp. SDUM812003]MDQ8201724.1 fructosamine kinase family protein [Pelagicoccus sp. SDUM812003]
MDDRALIENALYEATGKPFSIASQQAIGGGCINDAFRLQGEDRSYFLKSNRPHFADAYAAEALALRQLGECDGVRVPKVIVELQSDTQAYLILEYIPTRASRSGDWESLGRGLAELHAVEQPFFGWERDNLIGATPQPNERSDDWIAFFRERRLEHQLRLCHSRGFTPRGADTLLERLEDFFEDHRPHPSLLHGDLWSGNVAFDADGQPFIFDPGSYYGDREADIAFTEFFGGFSREFYEAYNDSLSLSAGYSVRKTLYNLYHCLNHVYLFGSGYTSQAEEMVRQLLSEV